MSNEEYVLAFVTKDDLIEVVIDEKDVDTLAGVIEDFQKRSKQFPRPGNAFIVLVVGYCEKVYKMDALLKAKIFPNGLLGNTAVKQILIGTRKIES